MRLGRISAAVAMVAARGAPDRGRRRQRRRIDGIDTGDGDRLHHVYRDATDYSGAGDHDLRGRRRGHDAGRRPGLRRERRRRGERRDQPGSSRKRNGERWRRIDARGLRNQRRRGTHTRLRRNHPRSQSVNGRRAGPARAHGLLDLVAGRERRGPGWPDDRGHDSGRHDRDRRRRESMRRHANRDGSNRATGDRRWLCQLRSLRVERIHDHDRASRWNDSADYSGRDRRHGGGDRFDPSAAGDRSWHVPGLHRQHRQPSARDDQSGPGLRGRSARVHGE